MGLRHQPEGGPADLVSGHTNTDPALLWLSALGWYAVLSHLSDSGEAPLGSTNADPARRIGRVGPGRLRLAVLAVHSEPVSIQIPCQQDKPKLGHDRAWEYLCSNANINMEAL